jgi:hypothetical protein
VISDQLAELAAADRERRVPGAYTHRYRLNPPVETAVLTRAESAIGASLPAEYREFVASVGDGGVGPYYGVLPLATALDRLESVLGSLLPLGRDCPLSADVDFSELAGRPDNWNEHLARLESDPGYKARFHDLTEAYNSEPWLDGRLPIADYGCGDWFFLVVRGRRRGTVWADCTDNGNGLYCLEVDFLSFYQRWLDDALAQAAGKRHGPPYVGYEILRYGRNPRFQPPQYVTT